MKIENILQSQVISEANIADKIMKDPGRAKQLTIAWRHDDTLPGSLVAKLGPKPSEKDVVAQWGEMLDEVLSRTNGGDLSRDPKFADWLTKLYTSGAADWEDISGEGGDALAAWNSLSQRGLLDKKHEDMNRFKTLKQLQQTVVNNSRYRQELQRIRNANEIARQKKEKKELVLIDDERFWVAVPYNYGACYVFNNTGHISNFCTGSSSGISLFQSYAGGGPIYMIIDKSNLNEEDGKWQMHAQTNQLVNSVQQHGHDAGKTFGRLFPGLMRKIIAAINAHASEIKAASKNITAGIGYNLSQDIAKIKEKFPESLTKAEEDQDEAPEQGVPGTEGWYQVYLAPNFEDVLSGSTEERMLRLSKDGGSIKGKASSLEELFRKIYEKKRSWLDFGVVTKAEEAPDGD